MATTQESIKLKGREYYPARLAAQMIGIAYPTLTVQRFHGKIKGRHINGRLFFTLAEINGYVDNNKGRNGRKKK